MGQAGVMHSWIHLFFTKQQKKLLCENLIMGDCLGCCDHEMEFKVLGGVRKENCRVRNFIQEAVVWVPWETSVKGK